ncbi:MAG: Do family serine endopeptidase [Spirochaetaceae bacterium]
MKQRKLFYSKKFFLLNLVLTGVLVGFAFSFIIFGCSTDIKPGETAYAQEDNESSGENGNSVESLRNMQNSFRSVAENVLPVVVELQVVEIVKQQAPTERGWPWDFFFPDGQNDNENDNNDREEREREFRNQGLGSGVMVRSSEDTYYVLTNDHVVGEADEIRVIMHDETEYMGTLVGKDTRRDLALVEFTTEDDLPVANLGDSDEIRVGDWVLAVGSPFGFVSSVTAGIVSAKGRTGPEQNISDFIQTDAAINRGNSGGALVNIDGEVVGINTWIAAPTGGSIGLGFAIPINNAKRAIDDIIEKGEVEYGWLGVTITDLGDSVAEDMNIENRKGAFIHNVYTDSPADKGGILPGDFVTQINGENIQDRDQLVRTVGDLMAGETAEFNIIRYGEEKTLRVEIGRRENQEAILSQQAKLWPGMMVIPLTEEVREEMEIEDSQEGVVVANVEKQTKPYVGGIRPYDIITEINGNSIDSLIDYYRAINDKDTDRFEVGYVREGDEFFVGIKKE